MLYTCNLQLKQKSNFIICANLVLHYYLQLTDPYCKIFVFCFSFTSHFPFVGGRLCEYESKGGDPYRSENQEGGWRHWGDGDEACDDHEGLDRMKSGSHYERFRLKHQTEIGCFGLLPIMWYVNFPDQSLPYATTQSDSHGVWRYSSRIYQTENKDTVRVQGCDNILYCMQLWNYISRFLYRAQIFGFQQLLAVKLGLLYNLVLVQILSFKVRKLMMYIVSSPTSGPI